MTSQGSRYDASTAMPHEPTPALVAVIEDDAIFRAALGRLLRVGGFEPALFDSAETFIASQPTREWLCLIVDVHLTGMSGIDLQRTLRSEGSEVPIIITTGDRADAIRERAEQAGCAAFLLKPFSADTLLPFLRSIPLPDPPDPPHLP
jgi:FixJ family two-component response regulator